MKKAKHEGCYAARLGGCGGGMSREHATSKSVLEEIDQGKGVDVSGQWWLGPGTTKRLPPTALASRVLCRDHNFYLSKYDTVGKAAFLALRDGIKRAQTGSPGIEDTRVDPTLFGGWLLKMFCGHAASGQLTSTSGEQREIEIPNQWLAVLFDREPWPTDWITTLTRQEPWAIFTEGGGVECAPLDKKGQVGAVEVVLHGIAFLLFFERPPATLEGARVIEFPVDVVFRPLRGEGETHVIFADEAGPRPDRVVELQLTGKDSLLPVAPVV